MAKGVVHINWYATLGRGNMLADGVAEMAAPASLKYGATHYSVMRSRDDLFKITEMVWFNSKEDWYRYWDGPEMIEFRARYSGKFHAPMVYVWQDEIAFADGSSELAAAEQVTA